MDHFLFPRGAMVLESETAPYIAEVYDDGPFLDFPKRSRFRSLYEKVLPPEGYPSSAGTIEDQDMRQLEILTQTWLVFGLFHEIFESLASQDDFVVHDPEKKRFVLSTKKLPHVVDQWITANFGVGDELERKEQLEHLITCLRLAYSFLSTLCKRPNIEPTVMKTTASIVETLQDVICETLDDPASTRSLGLIWPQCYKRDGLLEAMIDNGWCPTEARRWTTAGESIQVLNYLSKLKRPKTKDHSACIGEVCMAHQYDMERGHAIHRCQKGDCGNLEMDIGQIKAAFDEGFFGMLDATGEEDFSTMTVRVVSSKENAPYVALSHVWADGLGNPVANTLPRCQMAYVATIVKELKEQTKSERMLFWLDTICCPVDSPGHRTQCLARMKQIYQNAAHVLVLDAQMSLCTRDETDLVEIAARIIFSAWTCRLWTLQEGALASSLWVQMKDGPVDLDLVETKLSQLYKTRFINHPLLLILFSYLRRIRRLGSNANMLNLRNVRGPDLIDVQMALNSRTVSVASDEAICLCTLLDLDQLLVAQARPEDRMYAFWSTAGSEGVTVPKSIVFFQGSRSEHPGLRWAPRSFLGEVKFPMLRRPKNHDETAVVSPNGLLAEFPAAELRLRNVPSHALAEHWNEVLSDMPNLRWLRGSEQVWYMLIYPDNDRAPARDLLAQGQNGAQEQRIVAILANGLQDLGNVRDGGDVTFGSLGIIADNQSHAIEFRSARAVYFARMVESIVLSLEAVYQHSSARQISSIMLQLPKDPSEEPLTKDELLSRLPNATVAELLDVAKTAFRREPDLVHTFVKLGTSDKTEETYQLALQNFAAYLTFFVAGRTGEILHVWPRNQRWCVD